MDNDFTFTSIATLKSCTVPLVCFNLNSDLFQAFFSQRSVMEVAARQTNSKSSNYAEKDRTELCGKGWRRLPAKR